ncbi:hypothetical protein GIHI108528_10370 [Gillisia hiemivivida]
MASIKNFEFVEIWNEIIIISKSTDLKLDLIDQIKVLRVL